jgi:Ca2+-binding EF-hand superfamily protein
MGNNLESPNPGSLDDVEILKEKINENKEFKQKKENWSNILDILSKNGFDKSDFIKNFDKLIFDDEVLSPTFLYDILNKNRGDSITFNDYVFLFKINNFNKESYLKIKSIPKSSKEFIEYVFSFYDRDNDGIITKEELIDSINQIYKESGKDIYDLDIINQKSKIVNTIFDKCDKEQNNIINLEELITFYSNNKTELFNMFYFYENEK